jgi:hypothetical protein
VFGVSWRAYRAILVACVVVYGLPFGVSVWGIAAAALVSLSVTGVAGMIADACSVNTLDADPEKVRQLEEETGFALPTLDDAEIKTLVQQVQDATGLSQDKAIAYVANDLERPTNAIQSIVNPIKAALRSQPPVAAVAMLVDINGHILKTMPLPPPPWPTSGDQFRCPDKLVYQARETVMTRGFRIRVGDIQTPVTRFNGRSTVTMNSPDILKVEMCVEQEIYDELCRQYTSRAADRENALLAQIVSHTMSSSYPLPAIMPPLDNYTYPIGKETK